MTPDESPFVSEPVEPPTESLPVVADQQTETPPTIERSQADGELFVIAKYPYQMQKCQDSLVDWVNRKLADVRLEAADLKEGLEVAHRSKWATGALSRASHIARERVVFYEKMKSALDAGYVIVPDFPVDLIAVRVGRKKPRNSQTDFIDFKQASTSIADVLPEGEGVYVDDEQEVRRIGYGTTDEKTNKFVQTHTRFRPSGFKEMDLPFVIAKPEVLTAVARATAEKVFDEIGILPAKRPSVKVQAKVPTPDPIIVGRIIDPTRSRGTSKFAVTFMIAWYIDTRDL